MAASATELSFVRASQLMLEQLEIRGDPVPEELRYVQELLVCLDDNAQRIAASLASTRRRPAASNGADTTAMLLREQQQHLLKIAELYEALAAKPLSAFLPREPIGP